MRRTITVAAAALLSSAPAAAQAADQALAAGWRLPSAAPVLDPRLRVDFGAGQQGPQARLGAGARLSLVQWTMLGMGVGCVAGAVAMSAGHDDDREKPALRMQGCILGGSIGGFVLGVYGLATGARGP